MHFAEPSFLVLGAAACGLLLWLWRRLERARAAGLREMAADRLVPELAESVSRRRRRIRLGLLLLGVAALFGALARPQSGFRWEEAHRKGIDIMLALDTSKSMLAKDVAPNRLERAKLSILDLLQKLEGDRVGLIPFAGEAYLMCPLTLDYDAFRQSLATVDTDIVPVPGTDLSNVIRVAQKALDSEANHKILVLITDGEDLEGDALAEAKRAAQEGVTIHTVGVGTAAGELVPDSGGFLRDEKGQLVKSRLDEKTLREIASAAGGLYEPIGGGSGGLEAIYRQKLSLVPKEDLLARRHKVPLERFQWALALGGLALLVEMVLGDRKRAWRLPRLGRAAAGAAVLLAATAAHASPQDAEKAYREGEFKQAAEEYRGALERAPADARLHQGLAAASYKSGDFEAAAESYRRAIRTDDLSLQNEAYYGLGNALFREGQEALAKDPKQTIAKWEEALTQYGGALKLDPKDEDARFNRDVVQRKLDELRKQQEQQQKEKKNDQQQKQDRKQQQDPQNQQGQQKQDQQQKDEQQQNQQKNPQQQAGQGQQQQKNDQQAGNDQQQQRQQGQGAGKDRKEEAGKDQDQQQDPQQQQKSQQQAGHDGQQQDQQQAGHDPAEPRADGKPGQKKDGKGEKDKKDKTDKTDKKPRTRLDQGDGEQEGKPDLPAGKAKAAEPAEGAAEGGGSDAEAREAGRMTREQARQLLDSLREDEGQLAFVPQYTDRNRKKQHRRDW